MYSRMLLANQLTDISDQTGITPSNNSVSKCSFLDPKTKEDTLAYRKKVGEQYSVFAAINAVAHSVLGRIILPNNIAETLLFLNNKEAIMGTVSVAIRGFNPLLTSRDSIPIEKNLKDRQCPTVDILLEQEVAYILVILYVFRCPDVHPFNLGTSEKGKFVFFDTDECSFDHIGYIKPKNLLEKLINNRDPHDSLRFSPGHLINFPILNHLTHWPTNNIPGNYNICKSHASTNEFRKLAAEPKFYDQVFTTLLKILTLWQPEIVEAQFEAYFGNKNLNFREFNDEISELKKKYPEDFRPEFDNKSIVNYLLRRFKKLYSQAYQLTVFFPGCEKNDAGIPVKNLKDFIVNNRNVYTEITKEISQLNTQLSQPYSLIKTKKRYHRIFRDAWHLTVENLLFEVEKLIDARYQSMDKNSITSILDSSQQNEIDLSDLSGVLGLIEKNHPIVVKKIKKSQNFIFNKDKNNDQEYFNQLVHLYSYLAVIVENYYSIKERDLTVKDNQIFISDLSDIVQYYQRGVLFQTMMGLSGKFNELICRFNFKSHLNKKNNNPTNFVSYKFSESILKDTIKEFAVKSIFNWAEKNDSVLDDYIINIINTQYSSSIHVNRTRDQEVKEYLHSSCLAKKADDGKNRLARVLSTGGSDSTSLNYLLLFELIKHTSNITIKEKDCLKNSILTRLLLSGDLDIKEYTECAMDYAKNDPKFNHFYSYCSLKNFNKLLYDYVSCLPQEFFRNMVQSVLNEYEPAGYNFFSTKKRGPEIKKTLASQANNSQMLSEVFKTGGYEENSFNTLLFHKVLAVIETNQYKIVSELYTQYEDLLKSKTNSEMIHYFKQSLKKHALKFINHQENIRKNSQSIVQNFYQYAIALPVNIIHSTIKDLIKDFNGDLCWTRFSLQKSVQKHSVEEIFKESSTIKLMAIIFHNKAFNEAITEKILKNLMIKFQESSKNLFKLRIDNLDEIKFFIVKLELYVKENSMAFNLTATAH